jgi:MraZ protein
VLFTGEYEHTIDAKQRLAIPSEIRAAMDPKVDGEAFYAAPGVNGALWLWPERAFEAMANKIEKSLLPAEELMEFDEITFPEARRLELDSAGRIRLPERLLARSGLGSTVLILGMRNHLELRDPGQWERGRQERQDKRRQITRSARQAQIESQARHDLSPGGKKDGS